MIENPVVWVYAPDYLAEIPEPSGIWKWLCQLSVASGESRLVAVRSGRTSVRYMIETSVFGKKFRQDVKISR